MTTRKERKAAKKAAEVAFYEESFSDESDSEPELPNPFRFLDLPSEIRERIYHFVLFTPTRRSALLNRGTVGASAKKSKAVAPISHRIGLFLASRQIHDEASYYFYSTQIFRVFPIQDFSRIPTVRALPRRHRSSVTIIELILGNSWTAPPRSWVVNQGLGLHDMTLTRTLKVFIECDPSQPVFEGFRVSKEYYTEFAGKLLHQILERLPGLVQIEFDAYPSVQKNGSLMRRLLMEAQEAQKRVLWGPERGWTSSETEDTENIRDPEVDSKVDAASAAVDGLRAHIPGNIDVLAHSLQAVSLDM
ncbi:hypothetical protein N7495_008224 [Penicillium taxi]|uniref:uncharacterized protein n=1 Tax=Penicillium taxi TaxID=168475 RepID=UPI0025451037|nr:uncharacterized protein N7495_008224 [Penicillium taxi]KAJ5888183.1 hypothetical protein N7495_008224 [Penicillium taxi]